MVSPVSIQNFKSIRSLSFEARRVNVFIGEPNTGKSNVVEALGMFCSEALGTAPETLRCGTTADLFYDQRVANPVTINAGPWGLAMRFVQGKFEAVVSEGEFVRSMYQLDHRAITSGSSGSGLSPFRFYQFRPIAGFPHEMPGVLRPPHGDNLVAVLYSNEALRQRVGTVLRSKGFRLQLKPTEHELLLTKDVNDELYSYPWRSVSETIQRVVFLMAALETNRNAVLLLDEPEASTFPFYTKYLAEQIAREEANQFFLTTHNPYLLSSLVQNTKPQDLAVFVARMERFETKLSQISEARLPELLELDSDAFFNLDRLAEG